MFSFPNLHRRCRAAASVRNSACTSRTGSRLALSAAGRSPTVVLSCNRRTFGGRVRVVFALLRRSVLVQLARMLSITCRGDRVQIKESDLATEKSINETFVERWP